jgi:hypothetical protein
MLVLGNLDKELAACWAQFIPGAGSTVTPKVIFEFWELWYIKRNDDGPMAKLSISKWSSLGYASSCVSANATQVGGVVDRKWLICVRTLHGATLSWNWPTLPTEIARSMANCLRPV